MKAEEQKSEPMPDNYSNDQIGRNEYLQNLQEWKENFKRMKAEEQKIAKVVGKFRAIEYGSQYQIEDDRHVWGLAYGKDAAEFIVTACNNFEAMVMSLEILIDYTESEGASQDYLLSELRTIVSKYTLSNAKSKIKK